MKNLLELIKEKKIAVFDLDGTIADTEYLHWMAHGELLKEWNVTLSRDNILKYIGNNEYKIFSMMEEDFNISIDKEKAKRKRLDMFRKLVQRYNILPFKESLTIIKNFEGRKIILSSQSRSIIEELLKKWEIYEEFDEIISLENSIREKAEVITQIGNSNDIVWFEDSVSTIKKGKLMGYYMVGVKHRYNKEVIERYADYIIDTVCIAKGLFVGLCTKDNLYYIDEFPEKNCKTKTTKFNTYIGGPAANAAIAFSYLGGKATIATCLGGTEESKTMIKDINALNISVLNYSSELIKPNNAAIVISDNGDRTIISGQHKFEVSEQYRIEDYDFILFDCNQQEISLNILEKTTNIPIILDAGSWKENVDKFLKKADFILASENFKNEDNKNLLEMDLEHSKYLAVTRGEKNILSNYGEIEVNKVEVVDTLGAGDIFHGAFCYYYFNCKKNFIDSLNMAGMIASESVKYEGPIEWCNHLDDLVK